MSKSYYIPAYRVSLIRDGQVDLLSRPELRDASSAVRAIFAYCRDNDAGIERFGVLLLNVRHRVIGIIEVSVGCLTGSFVHPREVFVPALVHKAAAIIAFHNHPSGSPEPSAEDLTLTKRLSAAGSLLGVELLDHVIVGDGTDNWISLKERGVV